MRYTISLASAILAVAGASARAEVPSVVTDIPPVGALVAKVMGDLGAPDVLLTGGADPHDFQLRPSQARALSRAGLVVWVGPELTPWLDRALDGSEGGARLALLGVEGTHTRRFVGGEDHDHDHEGEHAEEGEGHDHDEAEADHDHDAEAHGDHAGAEEAHDHHHTGTDPHAWLDPANAVTWLGAISAELSRLDPEHAATYAANAAQAATEITALDEGIRAKLAPVKDSPFVTFHDAYGYLTEHYGLTQIGAVAEGDAASPGAARLRALQTSVSGKTVCLFPEVQHDPVLVNQMAEATGAKLGQALDPEGSSLPVGPGAYAALLNGLADRLVDCLAN